MPSSEAKLHLFFGRQMFSTNNLLNDFKRERGERMKKWRKRGQGEEKRKREKEKRRKKKEKKNVHFCHFFLFLPVELKELNWLPKWYRGIVLCVT